MGAKDNKNLDRIIWMDLEMTGLDPKVDTIIEIATIITDDMLNIVAEGPEIVIYQDEERFDKMDDWNQKHHLNSGLWGKVRSSNVTLEQAETETFAFIEKHVPKGKAPLAGNSIWQDRRFLVKYMPKIDQFLHYRMIDVSTIKELARRWKLEIPQQDKKNTHRAMDDIIESIEELRAYANNAFKLPQETADRICEG